MARINRSQNPFDDDDPETNGFVMPSSSKTSTNNKHDYGDFGWGEEDDVNDDGPATSTLQSQMEARQQNMLQSTHRSLGLVYESENIGNETAHELLRQGEQLQGIDKKLDKINKDIDQSKKHVTSLRSVFGGVFNYFQNKKATPETEQEARSQSSLRNIVDKSPGSGEQDRGEHPAMRLRDPNPSRYNTSGFGSSSSGTGTESNSRMQDFDRKLDDNLDELSAGLGRLKDLGRGLGDELDKQNDDLDRITFKTEKVDTRIDSVNTDVKKILRR